MLLGGSRNNLEIYIVYVASEQLVLYWALGLGQPIVHNVEREARAHVGGIGVTKEPQPTTHNAERGARSTCRERLETGSSP